MEIRLKLKELDKQIDKWQREVLLPLIPNNYNMTIIQILKINEKLEKILIELENIKSKNFLDIEKYYGTLADCYIIIRGILIKNDKIGFILWKGIKATFIVDYNCFMKFVKAVEKKHNINLNREWYFDTEKNVIKHK